MGSDLQGGPSANWLVIGWFTPDYRPLAEQFASNLAEHAAPFHLFARPTIAPGWSPLQKPSVVLNAMKSHPGKTLALMDVDCIVRGSVAPLVDISGDVGIRVTARTVWLLWPLNRRPTVDASSRVVVFRPTAAAHSFASKWDALCRTNNHDEIGLVQSFLTHHGCAYSYLDPRYVGREVTQSTPDDVIVHDSAHERLRRLASWNLAGSLKSIERRFRTGRTKLAKQRGFG